MCQRPGVLTSVLVNDGGHIPTDILVCHVNVVTVGLHQQQYSQLPNILKGHSLEDKSHEKVRFSNRLPILVNTHRIEASGTEFAVDSNANIVNCLSV